MPDSPNHPVISADKKVRILNLGCSKNQVDSESILGEFGRAGFTLARAGEATDVTVINTCGFIEAAKEESIQEILEAVDHKAAGEKLVVAGCLSQRYMENLREEIPGVDLYVGTYKPGELVAKLGVASTAPSDCRFGAGPRTFMGEAAHHAFLKIAEGCNRICGFCAIPGMRGKQRSRTIADIVEEARQLQSWGIKEVSLIAQDLTYFGREKGGRETLEGLLQALIRETDIPWFRLMYAYPAFVTDGLLEVMANEKRVCKYLDMPVQHASSRVLKAMRRNYDGDQLRESLLRLRRSVPGIALWTTVLVGYPGETEADVEELLSFMEETRFRHLGGFVYSDEEGTYAYDLEGKLPLPVMEERLERVMTLQRQISLEQNEARVGQTLDVIIDGPAEEDGFKYIGRTEGDAPEVDDQVLIRGAEGVEPGSFQRVQVTDAREYDLEAELQG